MRVVERDLVNRIGFAIVFPLIFLGHIFNLLQQTLDLVIYTHWFFITGCVVLPIILFYILRLGYVEFDNIKERVVIKRYHYKFLPARVVLYQDIESIGLNLNETATEHHSTFTKYFFKLKLIDGRVVPLFKVSSHKKGKKIETWMNDHLKFKINTRESKLNRRRK